jgi:hypothetical protein
MRHLTQNFESGLLGSVQLGHCLGFNPSASNFLSLVTIPWASNNDSLYSLPKVEIQGEFNEQNITLTDSGQIKCGDVSNTAPYLDVGKWCFIRTNLPNDVRYRNVAIMQI